MHVKKEPANLNIVIRRGKTNVRLRLNVITSTALKISPVKKSLVLEQTMLIVHPVTILELAGEPYVRLEHV